MERCEDTPAAGLGAGSNRALANDDRDQRTAASDVPVSELPATAAALADPPGAARFSGMRA